MLLGPWEGQAEGMWKSDQAFEGRQKGRDGSPACPGLLLLPHAQMCWGHPVWGSVCKCGCLCHTCCLHPQDSLANWH